MVESLLKNGNIKLYGKVWIDKELGGFWTTPEEEAERAGHTKIAKMIREWKKEQEEQEEGEAIALLFSDEEL